MIVTFHIAQSDLHSILNFERIVRGKIKGLYLERLETTEAEILYQATTDIPNNLLLLGAAIWLQNEKSGYYENRTTHKETPVAGSHPR